MRNDGGPAFPIPDGDCGGMSLRDYFAAAALMGIAGRVNADVMRRYFSAHYDGREAVVAYKLADAMLEERSKP